MLSFFWQSLISSFLLPTHLKGKGLGWRQLCWLQVWGGETGWLQSSHKVEAPSSQGFYWAPSRHRGGKAGTAKSSFSLLCQGKEGDCGRPGGREGSAQGSQSLSQSGPFCKGCFRVEKAPQPHGLTLCTFSCRFLSPGVPG